MEMELVQQALSWALKVLGNYYRIGDYVRIFLERRYRTTTEHVYNDERDFWLDMLSASHSKNIKRLHEGHLVTFRRFQITQWVPLLPGVYWTRSARELRRRTRDSGRAEILYLPGEVPLIARSRGDKALMMTGGYGSVRLKSTTRTSDGFALFCATSSGNSWQGIPILVPPALCDTFIQRLGENEGIEAEHLTGRLIPMPFHLRDLIPLSTRESPLGRHLVGELEGPELIMVVESPLNANLLRSDHGVFAVAWATYQAMIQEQDIPGFTYHLFDTRNESSYAWARTFLHGYAVQFNAHKILTEFDEYRPWSWEQHRGERDAHGDSNIDHPNSAGGMTENSGETHMRPGEETRRRPERVQGLLAEADACLDAIDAVLEGGAEEFVRSYHQPGNEEVLSRAAHLAPSTVKVPIERVITGELTEDEVRKILDDVERWQQGLLRCSPKLWTSAPHDRLWWPGISAPGWFAGE